MKPYPSVIIFDVDGVLVDTRGSFQRTTLETVKFFTKKRVTARQLHGWKNRPGFNDDWKLSTAWVKDLGFEFEYEEVKTRFQQIYWGKNGKGNVPARNGFWRSRKLPALRSWRNWLFSPAAFGANWITRWTATNFAEFSRRSSPSKKLRIPNPLPTAS